MASMGMQLLASALCLVGWAGLIIICILPMWRVTAFVGSTIVTSQTIWEGIWMTCVVQSTGQIQCKPYDSMLALTSDLQAARALTVLAIATGSVGLILAFVGGKCTRFLDEEGGGTKGKVAVAAGAVLIATGLLCLIPTSWTAGSVVRKFYSASLDVQRRELGACLYLGWGASILLVLGGGLFISSPCPLKAHNTDKSPSVRYLVVRSSNGSSRGVSHRSGVPSAASHPVRVLAPRPQSPEGASTKPPLNTRGVRPEPSFREESERSWAPSTKSQMDRPRSTRSEHSEAPSTKSQMDRPRSTRSEHSEAPSTKSQMDRPRSTRSEHSEAPSTKSQLNQAEMEETLSDRSENQSSNPAKTYL
ncbi:claudin-4-like [Odontesthes bonariensis]|uniref:claudin-4-like n=1 Tax=Odontesthes bonariensis TaxID=219752 RepID=UPI003F58E40D